MAKDQMRSDQRRRAVIETVARVIVSRRTGSFTLEEIAQRMGGSRELIYYYFKSKADVIYQLMTYYLDLVDERMKSVIEGNNLPPGKLLEKVIRESVLLNCERWELARALWSDLPARQTSPGQARIIARRRKLQETDLIQLVGLVLQENGYESDLDSKTITRFILGMIASVSRWYNNRGAYSAAVLADYVVDSVNNGFLNAARPH